MFNINPMVGDSLGEYHLTELFTVTSSNFLFLAEKDAFPGQTFLLKRRTDLLLDTQEQQEAFLRQVDLLKAFQHPYVLPIFDAGFDHASPYIVTAYAENGSLYDQLQRQPSHRLPLEEIDALLARIGKALYAAHQEGLFHGNLKTQNIVFNAQKEAFLTDFLLFPSSPTRSTTKRQAPVTQKYDAQEIRTNQGKLSKESDQYALAAITYQLFTGQPPFKMTSKTNPNKTYKIRSLISPRRLNPNLSPSFEQVLLKALAKDPDKRYSDVPTFLVALALADENTHIPGSRAKEPPIPSRNQLVTLLADMKDMPPEPTQMAQQNLMGMPYWQMGKKGQASALLSRPRRVKKKRFIAILLLALSLFVIAGLIYASITSLQSQPATSTQSHPTRGSVASKSPITLFPIQKVTPTPSHTATNTPVAIPTPTRTPIVAVPPRSGCAVAYNMTDNGAGQFFATISITNRGTIPINGWVLSWTYSSEHISLSAVTGAQYAQHEAQVTLQNLSMNQVILPGHQINDIIIYGTYGSHQQSAPNPPTNFTLNGIQCA